MRRNCESELIDYFKTNSSNDIINYSEALKIVEEDRDESVFLSLKEFCVYSINDLNKEYIITEEDVLRHFSSAFHWHLLENGLPGS